ncbi:MAG: polyprenyl synthetase family protein [Lachnospiraceae bacterium]|nr:polyprenyl synthetase family protein [Lachnospiraceae bacterium]
MIKDIIAERVKETDAIIEGFLPEETGFARTVREAMNYSIHVGGKRLRPILMQEVYRMFGGSREDILHPFMAAIEMIHTYSLCHDDLPAMDNDMLRRGKPSTHAKFGEAMGILAGDGLLNYAFETAMKAFDSVKEDDAVLTWNVIRSLRILADKAGIYGMIGGQVADVEAEDQPAEDITMDRIGFIHENKTAAMIESSMMIGAALAGASPEDLDRVEKIGSDIGLAFQIRDDILDVTGDDKTLGKPAGSDERNGKATYVSLVGYEKAVEDVAAISQRAVDLLEELPQGAGVKGQVLKELIRSLVNRDR